MLSDRNYRQNRRLDAQLPQGMLNGQGLGTVSRFRYGLFSFGWCGCEIIAAYNLRQMIGCPERLSVIAREIYRHGHVLLGFFGTNVYVLSHYLKKHGIPAPAGDVRRCVVLDETRAGKLHPHRGVPRERGRQRYGFQPLQQPRICV